MTGLKGSFDEDLLLLCPNSDSENFNRFTQPHCETPIVKGVVCQLGRWPSDLFFAFLAACFIIASLIVLIIVTVALCLPSYIDNKWRTIESFEIEKSHNVYFLKLENQTWSTREFCYIETAARKYSDFNVYLINLLKDEPPAERSRDRLISTRLSDSRFIYSIENTKNHGELTAEEQLRKELGSRNSNIRNINVSIERFFKGSELSETAKELSNDMLEFAAKAQLLWNTPGIILSPSMYCYLDSIEKFVCNGSKQGCVSDQLATVEPKNDIQATGVPCQAFVGFLIHRLSRNNVKQKYTLTDAIEEYCPRRYYCPEIRILDVSPKCPTSELNCPVVYATTILQNEPNVITIT